MVEMDQEFRIPINARVRLRDGIDSSFYKGFGCVGNEGWIKKHKHDEYGFPQVYIEWDRNHWADNGAPDGWTWEEHFDIVEVPMSDDNKLAKDLIEFLQNRMTDEPETAPEATSEAPAKVEKDINSEREQMVNAALEILKSSDSFVVIGVEHVDHPDYPKGAIIPRAARFIGSAACEPLLDIQLTAMGSAAHQELALIRAAELAEKE